MPDHYTTITIGHDEYPDQDSNHPSEILKKPPFPEIALQFPMHSEAASGELLRATVSAHMIGDIE